MRTDNATPFTVAAMPTQIRSDKNVLLVVVKATFDFAGGLEPSVAEEQRPVLFADEFFGSDGQGGVKFESDLAPFKPRADVILVGSAHAPNEQPVTEVNAELTVGPLHKALLVVGNRAWQANSGMPPKATAPAPFTEMPIRYDRAFGGVDAEGGEVSLENPTGVGLIGKGTKVLERDVPLPNVESLDEPITSWTDRPPPAGLGCYGRNWQPRSAHMGTYDEEWAENQAPDPPEDFSSAFYNAAHPDLQLEGYLSGDENVRLLNVSPHGPQDFTLPGVQLAATITKSEKTFTDEAVESGPEETVAVRLNLDTLYLIPDDRQLVLIWRGFCDIADMTATEVDVVSVSVTQ